MPPNLPTHTQYLSHGLLPVVLASATNTCFICRETYAEELSRQPVILRRCGHIFCRTCITAWFDSGQHNANTCPLDRKVLFRAASAEDATADARDMDGEYTADTYIATPVEMNRARSPIEVTYVDGIVATRSRRLTYFGCQLVISDLWRLTLRLLRFQEEFSGPVNEPLDMDVEILRSCIQDAIPPGVRCGETEWAVLYECARQMLLWHADGEWDEGVISQQFGRVADELFEVGG